METRGAFEALRARVRPQVDAALASWLGARRAEAIAHGEASAPIVDALGALAMRGGKRLRAVLIAAAYEAYADPSAAGAGDVTLAGVAIELLQTYLLIHDDWMDRDEVRRGGPSVHASLRERFGSEREGDTGAILAGDLAAAYAHRALFEVPLAIERVLAAAKELARVGSDVVIGQALDARGDASTLARVEAVHALKTGSYTVRGPLVIGARLAGAPPEEERKLVRFAEPLGVAFQLRDDVLGTFGDPRATGKPRGSDLREGKRTALVAEVAVDREAAALLPRVLGVEDAPEDEVAALVARIERSGARARVEARVAALMEEARAAIAGLEVTPAGRAVLAGAVDALGERER